MKEKKQKQMLRMLPKLILILLLASRQVTATESKHSIFASFDWFFLEKEDEEVKISIFRDRGTSDYRRDEATYTVALTPLTNYGKHKLERAANWLGFKIPEELDVSQGQEVDCFCAQGVRDNSKIPCTVRLKNDFRLRMNDLRGCMKDGAIKFELKAIRNPNKSSVSSKIYFKLVSYFLPFLTPQVWVKIIYLPELRIRDKRPFSIKI